MEEPLSQKVAYSILACLPYAVKTESYVENDRNGRWSMLLRRDGEGQVPLMRVFDDSTLILYGKDKPQELECAIETGVKMVGYKIKFTPVCLGSSFSYLIEPNESESS